jgi:IPT/TIG domain/WXXGXW repeat (2 copies)
MRRAEPWLIAISLVGGLVTGIPRASAQPDVRDHRTPPPPPERDHRRPPPPGNEPREPREPPPAPREEREAPRAGFAWIAGRWDWRGGKWEWVAGRWERERAGKRWNAGRWDRQGDHWRYVEGAWVDSGPTPSANDRPHAPPPPPRDERPAPRPGYVFVHGRWDWRGGRWEWDEGRWERERPGQQWREPRWELRDGTYALIDGAWVNVDPAAGTPPPPPPPPGADMPPPPEHHAWRLERPTVSSYWPLKGKIGSRITIRGRNFPSDASVLWNGAQVNGAKVTPDEIIVAVPPGATSGMIVVHAGGRRELVVGNYEVAADYDAAAEAARLAEVARVKAEQDWVTRQRLLAKDHAARQAAFDRHQQELDQTREQRRAAWLGELRARWEAAFLADTDTQDELTLHAQRAADLSRMREVAELAENGKLVVRIGVAQSREEDRHTARMTALHDSFGRKP